MKPSLTALLGLSLSLIAPLPGFSAAANRTPPKPVETPSPAYPESLHAIAKPGRAVIEILVRADGTVGETKVVSADDQAFAAAALDVLPRWRFEPGSKDGVASDMRVTVPFHFAPPLPQQLNALFKRKVFQPRPESVLSAKEFGKKPKPLKRIQPVYPKMLGRDGEDATVEVKFIIAPDGTTINPDIIKPPRKEFVLASLAAIANASYPPPVKNGNPVYVEITEKLKFESPQTIASRQRGGGDFGGGGGGGGGGGFGGGGGGGDPD